MTKTKTITKTKQDKIKELREYLKSLSDDERKAIADKYGFHSIEGKVYSINNQALILHQAAMMNVEIRGTLGGFKQWISAGRVVRKGEHGLMIWFPSQTKGTIKEDNTIEHGNMRFFTTTIFDISQTEELTKN